MKKIFFISAFVFGFAMASKAQTVTNGSTEQPSVSTATPSPAVATGDTTANVKKECAGHGTSACKGGQKACCKAKAGQASATTPNPAATPTAGATSTPQGQTSGATTKENKCNSGGACCKKKK